MNNNYSILFLSIFITKYKKNNNKIDKKGKTKNNNK